MKSYSDLQGDGGSDVVGQVVARQKEIAKRLSSVKEIIAVGSGKGGVGKSTVVTRLARAFKQAGKRVGVLDADFNGPTQARMSGVQKPLLVPGKTGLLPPKSPDGIPVLSFAQFLENGMDLTFDSVAVGDSHTWRATKEFAVFSDILASVEWGELDILLIDLPPGTERTLQFAEFLGSRTNILLVTVPSQVALEVVERTVSALKRLPNKTLGYIENMRGYFCEKCNEIKPLFPTDHSFTLHIPKLGAVPFDPEVAAACDRGAFNLQDSDQSESKENPVNQFFSDIVQAILTTIDIKDERHEVSVCSM